MKSIVANYILILLFASLFSCKKEEIPKIDPSVGLAPVYHISFYDHKSGEKITGLNAFLITYDSVKRPDIFLNSDADGILSFNTIRGSHLNQYLRLLNQPYVDVLYRVNDIINSNAPVHIMEGSRGPNVVNAKLLRKVDNDFYFRADLYLKVPVDIHVIQVSDYPDSIILNFNAAIYGMDPSDTKNFFGTNDIFGEGLHLNQGKKIDTTISVFAFGDYLNKVSWNVYEIVPYNFDLWSQRTVTSGELEEKLLPSNASTKITITF